MALQRSLADVFLSMMCDRTTHLGGRNLTYFEKHRGDETPYARTHASDAIFEKQKTLSDKQACADAPLPISDSARNDESDGERILATEDNKTTGIIAETATTSLKVYQVDLEVAGLHILPDCEILASFKLLTNLTRIDKCTGRAYAQLHFSQQNVLPVRSRYEKQQRLHTSDGDKAQSLAERALSKRQDSKTHPIPTYRSQCQVHRVFHVLEIAMRISAAFITGEISMALALRGPGCFASFKKLFWDYISVHNEILDPATTPPNPIGDTHRQNIWAIFFPRVYGRTQRKQRLRKWIITKICNSDIRVDGVVLHICKQGCRKGQQDFLRKLRWFVAILSGRLCIIINRQRRTKLEDGVDWCGIFANTHSLLRIIYGLWYHKVTGKEPLPLEAGSNVARYTPFELTADVAPENDAVDDANDEHVPNGPDNEPAPADQPDEIKSRVRKAEGLAFVDRPSLESDTCAIKMISAPVNNLMHGSLEMGGAPWDKLQYAKAANGNPREYRATNAALLKLETKANAALRVVVFNDNRWGVIRVADRTVNFQNMAFRMGSALGCGISKKHTREHSKFPVAGVLWIFCAWVEGRV